MKLKFKKQKGFGLLELMLSMVIVALLLVMATRYYHNARMTQRINQATSEINAVLAAANNYAAANNGYGGITKDSIQGFLPRDMKAGNPWGGNVGAKGNGKGASSTLAITMDSIPSGDCNALVAATSNIPSAKNTPPACSGSTFTITFDYTDTTS